TREFSLDDSGAHRNDAVLTFELKHEFAVFPRAGLDLRVAELRTAAAGDVVAINLQRQQKIKRLTVGIGYAFPLPVQIDSATSGSSRGLRCGSRCSSRGSRNLLQFERELM